MWRFAIGHKSFIRWQFINPYEGRLTECNGPSQFSIRYCESSGQLVSETKSSIYFSPNTEVTTEAEVCHILNIRTESLSDKHLGLPNYP